MYKKASERLPFVYTRGVVTVEVLEACPQSVPRSVFLAAFCGVGAWETQLSAQAVARWKHLGSLDLQRLPERKDSETILSKDLLSPQTSFVHSLNSVCLREGLVTACQFLECLAAPYLRRKPGETTSGQDLPEGN